MKRGACGYLHMLCTQLQLLRKHNIRETCMDGKNFSAQTERIDIELWELCKQGKYTSFCNQLFKKRLN